MKILLCLNKDIFSLIMLNLLLPFMQEKQLNISVAMTSVVGKQTISDITKIEKIIPFEGIFPTIQLLNKVGVFLTFPDISSKYNIPFHEVKTINNDFGEKIISEHDFILSIRFGSIFKEAVIKKAKNKIINLHSAVLPNYKGILGTFQALKNRDKDIATTLHFISDGTIDTGAIIKVKKIEADYDLSFFQNLINLYHASISSIKEVLDNLLLGKEVQGLSQDLAEGNYFSAPSLEEIESFSQEIMPIYTQDDIYYLIKKFTGE